MWASPRQIGVRFGLVAIVVLLLVALDVDLPDWFDRTLQILGVAAALITFWSAWRGRHAHD